MTGMPHATGRRGFAEPWRVRNAITERPDDLVVLEFERVQGLDAYLNFLRRNGVGRVLRKEGERYTIIMLRTDYVISHTEIDGLYRTFQYRK